MELAREICILASVVLMARLLSDLIVKGRFKLFRIYLLLMILSTLTTAISGMDRVAAIILVPVKILVTAEFVISMFPHKGHRFQYVLMGSLALGVIGSVASLQMPIQKGLWEPGIVQWKHATQAMLALFCFPMAIYSCWIPQELTAWRHGILVTALWGLYAFVGILVPHNMAEWLALNTGFWWIFAMLMVAWIFGIAPYRQARVNQLADGSRSEGGSGGSFGGSSASWGIGSGLIGFLSGFPMRELSHGILTKSDRSVEV